MNIGAIILDYDNTKKWTDIGKTIELKSDDKCKF